jgi:acylphosphatase
MTSRRFLVGGRVQGVGFRHFVVMRAREHGLAGWTRNLPDGRVEVLAQGEPEAVEALRSDLSTGPRHGQVDSVTSHDTPLDPDLSGFSVRP